MITGYNAKAVAIYAIILDRLDYICLTKTLPVWEVSGNYIIQHKDKVALFGSSVAGSIDVWVGPKEEFTLSGSPCLPNSPTVFRPYCYDEAALYIIGELGLDE